MENHIDKNMAYSLPQVREQRLSRKLERLGLSHSYPKPLNAKHQTLYSWGFNSDLRTGFTPYSMGHVVVFVCEFGQFGLGFRVSGSGCVRIICPEEVYRPLIAIGL